MKGNLLGFNSRGGFTCYYCLIYAKHNVKIALTTK